jgi:hypothetical protein
MIVSQARLEPALAATRLSAHAHSVQVTPHRQQAARVGARPQRHRRRSAVLAATASGDAVAAEPQLRIKADATQIIGNTPLVSQLCEPSAAADLCRLQVGACTTDAMLCSSSSLHAHTVAIPFQVRLNKVNEMCFADIVCKLELMEPCSSGGKRPCVFWFAP